MSIAEKDYSPAKEALLAWNDAIVDADSLLVEIAEENRRAALAELVWFAQTVGWNEQQVREQVRRMHSVLTLKAIAGTAEDRAAVAKEAETAAAVADKELPKIDEAMLKLQQKRDAIETAKRLAEKRKAEQAEAVEQLRKNVPEHIATAVRDAVNRISHSIGREINEAKTRLLQLEVLLDTKRHDNESRYLESLWRAFPDAVVVGENRGYITRQFSPAWPSIKSSMIAEAEGLREKIETMQVEHDAAVAAAESPLNYYSR